MNDNALKVAVVAGVGAGLGAAACRALAGAGYHTCALARSASTTESLAAEQFDGSGCISALQCDVTDHRSVAATFDEIRSTWGDPVVLLYNAHRLHIADFLDTDAETFEAVWQVVCAGAARCAREVLPAMQQKGSGTILFTGATAAIRGGSRFSAFASAKFGQRALAQVLAREFGPKGVHVAHLVVDGLIWGDAAQSLHGKSRSDCIDPDSIAAMYLQLIAQPKSAWTHELDVRPYDETF